MFNIGISTKPAFGTVKWTIYLLLMSLGVFFIYQGEVWERFENRRTNFAIYTRTIDELPTITTDILLTAECNNQAERTTRLHSWWKYWLPLSTWLPFLKRCCADWATPLTIEFHMTQKNHTTTQIPLWNCMTQLLKSLPFESAWLQ